MEATVAVVAHFDAGDRLDPGFRTLLACLETICSRIILVTTSRIADADVPVDGKIITVRRPNIGYDFYSWRVGIERIGPLEDVERLFIINSSFLVLNPDAFRSTLQDMLKRSTADNAVGITSSRQIRRHLQSYLLLLGKNVFRANWFGDFLRSIRPQNVKFEVIWHYEIGLSRLFAEMNVSMVALFRPRPLAALRGYWAWVRRLAGLGGMRGRITLLPLRKMHEVNWLHFAAAEIAREFGFVKQEVLRSNPLGINLDFLRQPGFTPACSAEGGWPRPHMEERRSLPTCRSVVSGALAQTGVNVAVVLHLYYVELLDEICAELQHLVDPFDLYVTTPFEAAVPHIIDRGRLVARGVMVSVSENRGRDVGPFIALYRSGVLDSYTAVLKLHSKRSKYSRQGDAWRRSLYRGLLGDSLNTRRILETFSNTRIGIIGPHRYYLTNQRFWGGNAPAVSRLLSAMGMHEQGSVPSLGFFAGSMFWFSPQALKPLRRISVDLLNFEPEQGMQDATLAHALERVFCSVARGAGYITTSVQLAGGEIHEIESTEHDVPVL